MLLDRTEHLGQLGGKTAQCILVRSKSPKALEDCYSSGHRYFQPSLRVKSPINLQHRASPTRSSLVCISPCCLLPLPARHEPLPNGWRLWPLSLSKASLPVSNFEYVGLMILWAWDAFAPFLSVLQPIGTVLFYAWLAGYNAAIPLKLIWIESQKSQGLGCSECNWVFKPSGTPFMNHWMK